MKLKNVEIYNFDRDYPLFVVDTKTKKIELNTLTDLAIIDTRNTSNIRMKIIRFVLKFLT